MLLSVEGQVRQKPLWDCVSAHFLLSWKLRFQTNMTLISAFKPPSTRPSFFRRRSIPLRRRVNRTSDAPSEPNAIREEGEEEADYSSIKPSKHTPRPLQLLKGSVAANGPVVSVPKALLHDLYRKNINVSLQSIAYSQIFHC